MCIRDRRFIRGEAVQKLATFVPGELQRFSARSQHHEKLVVSFYIRSEGHGMPGRRDDCLLDGLVPVTDLGDLARDIRRVMREEMVATVTGGKQKQQEGPRDPGQLALVVGRCCCQDCSARRSLCGSA